MPKPKIMISQPMFGKTEEEILNKRSQIVDRLELMGYEVVDTYFSGEEYSNESLTKKGIFNIPLYFIAKSLEKMSECHSIYFCKDWSDNRGCSLEYEAALVYGLQIYLEEDYHD